MHLLEYPSVGLLVDLLEVCDLNSLQEFKSRITSLIVNRLAAKSSPISEKETKLVRRDIDLYLVMFVRDGGKGKRQRREKTTDQYESLMVWKKAKLRSPDSSWREESKESCGMRTHSKAS